MKIKIDKLHIQKFKGLDFSLELNGKNAHITGENGTGKTTIADSWYWLISNKDGDQQSNFNVLTIDSDGNTIDHQDASVEAHLIIDKKKLTLKKVFRQKWTKKRGQAEKKLTGHTTDYYVDQVPVSKREYDDKIADIIDDKIFRILSDVRYFCTLPIDERRKVLISLIGDVNPDDIISIDPELSQLDSILSERELSDHKKILLARKRECNDQLRYIPARIDEKKLSIIKIDESKSELDNLILDIDNQIRTQLAELGSLSTGNGISQLEKQILELQKAENKLELDIRQSNTEKIAKKLDQKSDVQSKERHAEAMVKDIENEISIAEIHLEKLVESRQETIKHWQKVSKRTPPEDSDICFNCGQAMPDWMIAETIEKFNLNKASELRTINETGQNITKKIKELKSKIKDLENEKSAYGEKLIELSEAIKDIDKEIHAINNENNISYSKQQVELSNQIKELNEKIAEQKESIQPEKERIKSKIELLEAEKRVLIDKLSLIDRNTESTERVTELQNQLKTISTEYQNIERELYLIEKYDACKAAYIEENVSEKFAITTWKLFERQINEGIRDLCEPCYKGVPYSTNTSNGERILIGMDCINTLSRHYKISVPVFIDNAESLTNWIDFKHQHITLSAVENAKLEVTK